MNQYESDYKKLRLHPNKILLTLLLMGITMLFLAMSASYIYQRVTEGIGAIQLPYTFLINALVLMGSSYTLHQAKKAYLNDDTEDYKRQLTYTLGLTLLFMTAQVYAWADMSAQGLMPNTGPAVGYIYALAILHFVHVFAGIPFLVLFLKTAYQRMKEPVSVLIYFSDPEKRLKLRLLEVYWHYLDVLWLFLVVFFTVNYLIS